MKKTVLFLNIFVTFIFVTNSNAQVTNGDFEIVNPNGIPFLWGNDFVNPITIDINGIETVDSVIFNNCNNQTISATTNSHSGQYALEISNAFDETQNLVISETAYLSSGEMTCAGDFLNEISSNSPYTDNNYNLGFYYKFNSLGNDVAQATLELYGTQDGNLIYLGKAQEDITETNTEFKYIYSKVNLIVTNVVPEFMTITFTTAKEGSTPTFGSSLIIDDVTVNNVVLKTNLSTNNPFIIYPTIANQEINIKKGNSILNDEYNFQIINTEGKIISQNTLSFKNSELAKIDISQLSKGVYFLTTKVNDKENTTKFIKK